MQERLSDFAYELPPELIAQRPLPRRDASRMMILHRATGRIEHSQFPALPGFTRPGDLFVLNDSRVVRARHFSDDGRFEFLFLEKLAPCRWQVLVKPGRRFRPGAVTSIGGIRVEAGENVDEEGTREVVLERDADVYASGTMPLPPYIARADEKDDTTRYQTVFARDDGSIAAPTAGLHFTPEILERIPHAFVTLHVGGGTFRPVKSAEIALHKMHPERYAISVETTEAIERARRVIAVGTTTVRVLEAVQRDGGVVRGGEGQTDLFIRPPFQFQVVDALLTNFHLPRSTLLMLVSAFAGRDLVLNAYAEAVRRQYRFYSYGDCMLIV